MAPKLYVAETSPPVRSVLITAAAIGLELEKQPLDLQKGEHLTPEYLELNPQHTVPTLVDGDYVLWDSHAINPYLVSKYAKDDSLYPKDIKKRGIVDNRLHYDNATIFNTFRTVARPIFQKQSTSLTDEQVKSVEEIYSLLNTFLEKTEYIAGDNLTIADFNIIASVTCGEVMVPVDEAKFPKLVEWENKLKKLPCYSAGVPGLKKFETWFLSLIKE